MLKTLLATFLLAVLILPDGAQAQAGSWSASGAISQERYGASAARLNDGSVLLAGGTETTRAPGEWFKSVMLATADRFDPATGAWAPVAPMSMPRTGAPAITLSDGRVLIPGGRGEPYKATDTAEVFDPRTGAWSPAGKMAEARAYHGGVLLQDGRALVSVATASTTTRPARSSGTRRPTSGRPPAL